MKDKDKLIEFLDDTNERYMIIPEFKEMIEEIKGIVEKRDFKLTCPNCENVYLVKQSPLGNTMSIIKQSPDDELIKKILKIGIALSEEINNIDHFAPGPSVSQSGYDEAAKEAQKITKEAEVEIRKLLQSRQPEKLTVTRGEVGKIVDQLSYAYDPDYSQMMEDMEEWLRSKGFEVTGKRPGGSDW